MKKSFTKLLVSCAAVMTVAAAMAVSANAATYADGVIKTDKAVPAEAGKQATIIVYKDTKADVKAEDIVYINQDTTEAITALLGTGIPVAADKIVEGQGYVIKMGGEGVAADAIVTDTFGEVAVKYGDVDGDEKVNTADAVAIVDHSLKKVVIESDTAQYKAADVDASGVVNTADAVMVVDYALKKITAFPAESK